MGFTRDLILALCMILGVTVGITVAYCAVVVSLEKYQSWRYRREAEKRKVGRELAGL